MLEGLAGRLMSPGRDPLAPNCVVVQGPGMERWIAQSIAREYGVLANTRFPFPRGFLDLVFSAALGESGAKANPGWEVGSLTWRIARLLDGLRDDPDFEGLSRHLESADGDWRLVQLAHRIANLLDQYITNRPDWIANWAVAKTLPESGDARWQARLLSEVHREIGGGHVADRAVAFAKALNSGDAPGIQSRLGQELGGAIEVFAVSTLPPLYLSVIDQLATVCDVHLSVLSPSRHYWADLWREIKDGEAQTSAATNVFVGTATPTATLLAGLGRLGADFQRNLEEFSNAQDGATDLFETPGETDARPTMLEQLQQRFLELDDVPDTTDAVNVGDAPSDRVPRVPISPDDDSIRVHICHGTRRELEVVLGCLRDAFERDETLMPEDVLVMAPNIDELAPDLVAVFGASSGDGRTIPYRIADRGAFRSSKVASAFRDLLDLLGGRATRSEVFDWLANEPVASRFGLQDGGLEILAEWSERAGIRFGLDEDHRKRLGLSSERVHTFEGGLDRLALAHAVGASHDVYAGIAAVPLDPFGDPALLGALSEVVSTLRDAFATAAVSRDVRAWCEWLEQLLGRLFERTDSNAHEHALVRDVLRGLSDASRHSDFDRAIPFEAIRERLALEIESSPPAQPFLAGGVTFCELVPLRAIPFRVIAILGMSDDAFPRGRPALGFDLMARDPRPGDRSTRNDDRYLFLEALLSARDQLILTVPGRDVRDGRDLPPSVVVSDLLDMLETVFELDSGSLSDRKEHAAHIPKRLRDWLVVLHPLQASSPRYFESSGDARLLPRDQEAFLGARARQAAVEAGGGEQRRFLAEVSSSTNKNESAREESSVPSISLDVLIRRVLRSTRTFAREELRLRLPRPEAAVADLDPIDLEGLSEYALGTAMLDMIEDGTSFDRASQRLAADASVPSGFAGEMSLTRIRAEVLAITEIGSTRREGDLREDVSFSLRLDDDSESEATALVGQLDELWSGGRIHLGFTRIGRRAELEVWIRHLTLCCLVEDGLDIACRSVFVGRTESKKSDERVVVFGPVPDARVQLARLVDWALTVPDAPLPFFAKASRVYAQRVHEGKSEQGFREAHQRFEGEEGQNRVTPEAQEELETERIWEGRSPLASSGRVPTHASFEKLADEFFRPFLDAREVHTR